MLPFIPGGKQRMTNSMSEVVLTVNSTRELKKFIKKFQISITAYGLSTLLHTLLGIENYIENQSKMLSEMPSVG